MKVTVKKISEVDQAQYAKQSGVRRQRESHGGFDKIVYATDQD